MYIALLILMMTGLSSGIAHADIQPPVNEALSLVQQLTKTNTEKVKSPLQIGKWTLNTTKGQNDLSYKFFLLSHNEHQAEETIKLSIGCALRGYKKFGQRPEPLMELVFALGQDHPITPDWYGGRYALFLIDQKLPFTQHLRVNSTGDTDRSSLGLWSDVEVVTFMKRLHHATKLKAVFTIHPDEIVHTTFDLSGIDRILPLMAIACEWGSPEYYQNQR